MEVVDGRGRRLRFGGRVVKNVAGYDLCKLFTGSWGTLGIITEATLRTHPRPDAVKTLRFSFESTDTLEQARAALFASQLPLAAINISADGSSSLWTLSVRIEGTRSEVDYQSDEVRSLCRSTNDDEDDEWSDVTLDTAADDLVVICIARPRRCVELADTLLAQTRGRTDNSSTVVHGGIGRIYISCSVANPDDVGAILRDLQTVVRTRDARLLVARCPLAIKSAIDVWGEDCGGLSLMRKLKEKFDPNGVCCPGRFVSRI